MMKKPLKLFLILIVLAVLPSIQNIKQDNYTETIYEFPTGSRAIQNYTMVLDTSYNWINTTGASGFFAPHDDYWFISLPFLFPFYENDFEDICISTNSLAVSFYNEPHYISDFPNTNWANRYTIAGYSEEINITDYYIYTKSLTSPNRFAIIFENLTYWDTGNELGSAEIILYESGQIKIQYKNLENIEGSPFLGINRGFGLDYFNSYDNINSSMDEYAIDFNYGPNLYTPQLSDWEIDSGDNHQDEPIIYTVNYTDLDNHPPQNVNITINDTTYMMYPQNQFDHNYTDGAIYFFSKYLQPGTYNYSFGCYDGDYYYETSTFNGPTITKSNHYKPTLTRISYPEFGYINSTDFYWEIEYIDQDNNAPNYVMIDINGMLYPMVELSPTDELYNDGKYYGFSSNSTVGGYNNYTLYCSDGEFNETFGPYYDPYLKPILGEFNSTYLSGFNIAAFTYYGSFNPIIKYPDLVSDLEYRGATITEIDEELTESLLNSYDLLWVDDGGDYFNTPNIYETLDNWVYNQGGTILITGFEFEGFRTQLLYHYSIEQEEISYYPSTISSNINTHPISTNVTSFMYENCGPISTYSQPNASVFIETNNGYDIGVAVEFERGGIVAIADRIMFNTNLNQENNSLIANNTFGWLHSLNNSNLNDPVLTDVSLNPASGSQSTPFVFSVNYTDVDNYGPKYMNVVINNTAYMMYKKNLTDNDFTDGAIYEFVKYLQNSTYAYEYYFTCSDSVNINTTQTYNTPIVSYSNIYAPTLALGGVTPEEGESDYTNFGFTVLYTDLDNNRGSVNLTLNGLNYTMTKSSKTDDLYIDGCFFEYFTILNGIKTHQFNFTAFDGENYAFSGTYNNPKTNDTIGPILENDTITPYFSSAGEIFNLTIDVWDSTGINSVNGYIINRTDHLVDTIIFYDDGNHNDGAALDGTYGGSFDSSGFPSGPYRCFINATDTTVSQNVGEFDYIIIPVIDISMEFFKNLHYNITDYLGNEFFIGSHFVTNVTDMAFDSNYIELDIIGEIKLWNKSSGILEDLMGGETNIETYNFETGLYSDPEFPLVFQYLMLPIDLNKVNESLYEELTYPQDSKIYEENNTYYVLDNGPSPSSYLIQWNDLGILNYTLYNISGMGIFEMYLLENDTTPPILKNIEIFPYLPSVQGTVFNITAIATDQNGIENFSAIIHYPDLITNETVQLFDDGNHNDGIALDGIYGFSWDSAGKMTGEYNISINLTDNKGYNKFFENQINFTVTLTDISYPVIINTYQSSYAEGIFDDANLTYSIAFWDTSTISHAISYLKDSDGNVIAEYQLYDDGMHNDFFAEDDIFGWNFSIDTLNLEFGRYYLDIYCNDTSSNGKNNTAVITFSIIDWIQRYGDVNVYEVTKNDLLSYYGAFSGLPVGYRFRSDMFHENLTGGLSCLWGNTYYLDENKTWKFKESMADMAILNTTFNYYDCTIFDSPTSMVITPLIIPGPVNSDTLRWLVYSQEFQNDFSSMTDSYIITENSISIIYNSIEVLWLKYNEQGYLIEYSFKYSGVIPFEFELIYSGNSENNGIISDVNSTAEEVNTITFTLDYTQLEGINPFSINISVNGTVYEMKKVSSTDLNFIDGVTYTLTIELVNGSYIYNFSYYDGYKILITSNYELIVGGNLPNNPSGNEPSGLTPTEIIIISLIIGGIALSALSITLIRRKSRKSFSLLNSEGNVPVNQDYRVNRQDNIEFDKFKPENSG
jgi:hypothetical protein